ncbi:hypothetical protein FRX31_022858, partial [Thalictrum thalictroides]
MARETETNGKGNSNSGRSGNPTRVSSCSQPDSQEVVGKKSWDERVDIEEEREVVGSTNNKDDAAKGKQIPVGLNGVDRPTMGESIDGACNGGGVMGSYGIHSPKGLNDSNGTLMAMIQSTQIQFGSIGQQGKSTWVEEAKVLMRSSSETARDELFDGLFDDFCYDKDDLIREYEEDMAAH